MIRWLPTLLVLLSTLALAGPFGCPVSHVDTCEAQLRATCEFQFRCCDTEERLTGILRSFPYVATEGECIDRIAGYCQMMSAANDDAVEAGRLKFNNDKAQECVSALQSAREECDLQAFTEASSATEDERGPCAEVNEGLVEEGDACASDAECASEDSYCEIDFEDPDINEELGTRDGECVGPAGEGDNCDDRPCQDDLACTFDGATGESSCLALPGLGEPCPNFQCDDGLGCGYDTATAEYRCQQPAGLGESCAEGGLCAVPLLCTYDPVSYEQTCENPPAIGEPCPSFSCEEGAFCNDTASSPGTCEAQVEPGGECDPVLFDQCAGDSGYCDEGMSPPVCADYDEPEPVDPDQCNGA